MKYLVLIMLMFSLPAMGEKTSYSNPDFDFESLEDYDYKCSMNSVTFRIKEFYNRPQALDWCSSFGKYCVARRGEYRGWQGYFERVKSFKYTSNRDYRHSRWEVFERYRNYIDENRYFHQDFRHRFRFDGCYSSS